MNKIVDVIEKYSGATLLMLLVINPLLVHPAPTPSFPIGLTLTYEAEDEYLMTGTLHYTESFEVLSWLASDNSSFQLRRGFSQGGDIAFTIRNVTYPSWDYTKYDEEINETVDEAMYPLWTDVTDYKRGEDITIGLGTVVNYTFTIISNEEVKIGDGSIYCWVLECEYTTESNWEYTLRFYYDVQYGILIKNYTHRYYGSGDPGNVATFTNTLVASNVLDKLESPARGLFETNLTRLLVLGIGIEVIIIVGLFLKRIRPRS